MYAEINTNKKQARCLYVLSLWHQSWSDPSTNYTHLDVSDTRSDPKMAELLTCSLSTKCQVVFFIIAYVGNNQLDPKMRSDFFGDIP